MVILLSMMLSFYYCIMRIYRYIICILICTYIYYFFYIDKSVCISTKIQEKSEY